MSTESITFEQSLQRLDEIVRRMPLPYNGQCVSRAAKIILYFFAVFL